MNLTAGQTKPSFVMLINILGLIGYIHYMVRSNISVALPC